ncbi:tricyclene synthase TPS4, chloroplastic-like [Actinidia eriantha]|uniref:tricyclene synthase TPS4, chloroplastic-like n=1 Tax=Actinidia eriantha TaxID=165200 RepID=UPI0025864429|nr:tricyclene synthase TPS4, chloroplastic-like [Actinidia eriantha]
MAFEPEFNNFRKGLTQVIALIVAIDDIYDVYASMEELEQFTNAVERWSMDAAEKLSDSLKLCLQVLLNTVNEMAIQNFEEQRVETRSHFKRAWVDLCKAFLIEAKWQYTKYTPIFKEYMDNAWVSSSVLVMLVHAYCLISRNITKEALDCFDECNDLLYHPCMLFRLCNDLASAMADLEGDETAKSILCYMRDTGVSEEFAREDLRNLIDKTWKKMNKSTQAINSPFPKQFMDLVLNFSRSVHCIYQHGDAFGAPDGTSRRRVTKLLIEPVSSIFKNNDSAPRRRVTKTGKY